MANAMTADRSALRGILGLYIEITHKAAREKRTQQQDDCLEACMETVQGRL